MKRLIKYKVIKYILDKPVVVIEDENLTVTAGDQVTLECMVEANPMNLTLVEWYLDIATTDVSKCLFTIAGSTMKK